MISHGRGLLRYWIPTSIVVLILCGWQLGTASAQPGVALQEDEEPPGWRTIGFGPAMLLIPARPELGREAVLDQSGGAIVSRRVRMMSPQAGWEAVVGIVLHDEETLGSVWDWYNEGEDSAAKWLGLGFGWAVLPLAASSVQSGLGAFVQSSRAAPFVHGSFGLMVTPMLWRLSQPGLRFDVGTGVYGGMGVMFTDRIGLSARLSYDALLFHELAGRGYQHVWTGVATLDFRVGKSRRK